LYTRLVKRCGVGEKRSLYSSNRASLKHEIYLLVLVVLVICTTFLVSSNDFSISGSGIALTLFTIVLSNSRKRRIAEKNAKTTVRNTRLVKPVREKKKVDIWKKK